MPYTETVSTITETSQEPIDITSGAEQVTRVYLSVDDTIDTLADVVNANSASELDDDDPIAMIAIIELPDGRKVQGTVIELVLEQ